MKTSRTLIYGFGPYDQFLENITEAVVDSLKVQKNVCKEVFDTRFSRSMFDQTLKRYRPEVIIGLGQHSRARKLRVERKAVNLWGKRGEQLRSISKTGPERLYVNLNLPNTRNTTITYNAGTYVCNFSMYVCLEYCRKTGSRFAFVHVPKNCSESMAAAYVKQAINYANGR